MAGGIEGGSRLEAAIAAIDAANADDPETISYEGVERPKEQLHAELMTVWVTRLDPGASEAQLLAARAHHLRRWASPRTDEPPGRAGYLRWRAKAKERHAQEVASILEGCGYDAATIERVQAIVRKEGLRPGRGPGGGGGVDPAVQAHEDALCLVFLQTQLDPVAADLGDEKAVEVLRKTLLKMSEAGKAEALALPLSPGGSRLLAAALEPA